MPQFEFKFPDVGEGIQEGKLISWKVKEGDEVKEDQIVAEVETDKAVVEIPAPQDGKVLSLHGKEGEVVNVGDVFVTLEVAELREHHKAESMAEKAGGVVGFLDSDEKVIPSPSEEKQATKPSGTVKAIPAARKLAEKTGVDLVSVKGTGPNGIITVDDVLAVGGSAQPAKPKKAKSAKHVRKYDMWGFIEHVRYAGMRKAVGEHMAVAAKAPTVTHFDEAIVDKLVEVRAKAKPGAEKKGIKLTYLAYIVQAVQKALEQHPMLNSSFVEEDEDILVKKYYNIGVAVDVEGGLLVPVIKRVNQKKLLDIAKEIVDLAKKAQKKKLDPMDMKGGTFTISNVGSIGGIHATPVLNHPESAILLLGRMYDKPIAKDGKVVVAKVIPLSLTFDHRVVDGAEAARFTNTLKDILENPEKLK